MHWKWHLLRTSVAMKDLHQTGFRTLELQRGRHGHKKIILNNHGRHRRARKCLCDWHKWLDWPVANVTDVVRAKSNQASCSCGLR